MPGLIWLKNRLVLISLLVLIGQWNEGLFAQQFEQSEVAFPVSSSIYSDADNPFDQNEIDEYDTGQVVYLPYSEYFIDGHEHSNFRFRADFPLSGINALLDEVNLLEHDMIRYLSLSEERELIEIFIFEQKSNYLRFIMKEFPDAPLDRRALFVKKPGFPGIVVLQLTQEIDDDIRHEMTHALLHSRFTTIPLWLDEGLAEYFELHPDRRAFQKPYMKKAVGKFMFSKTVPSLIKLEKITDVYSFALKDYQESWAWIHFMIHYSKETHQLLAAYLRQVGHGKAVNPLEQYLAETLPEYKKEYITHFEKWNQIHTNSMAQLKKLEKIQKEENVEKAKIATRATQVENEIPPHSSNSEDVAAEKKPKTILFR